MKETCPAFRVNLVAVLILFASRQIITNMQTLLLGCSDVTARRRGSFYLKWVLGYLSILKPQHPSIAYHTYLEQEECNNLTPCVTFSPLAYYTSTCAGKRSGAGTSVGTGALVHLIFTVTHSYPCLGTFTFKHAHSSISTLSSLQIFGPSHSRRLIPSARIISKLVCCALRVVGRKSRVPRAGNRSRLTSTAHLVCSSFLICNWQVARFHKAFSCLPVIQCCTEGNF